MVSTEGTSLFKIDKDFLEKKAEELGYVRDNLEKMLRLINILEYFNTHPMLAKCLALKGGTAINLVVFDLLRLSVDIDLDYLITDQREQMFEKCSEITQLINGHMLANGYSLSKNSKQHHSLDSWMYDYVGVSGNRDHIKIDINYSLRAHLFDAFEQGVITRNLGNSIKLNSLHPMEIFASKINALINRTAARDLYDVYNMIQGNIFKNSEFDLLRKCVVFYAAITQNEFNKEFNISDIEAFDYYQIKRELIPLLRKRNTFELELAKVKTIEFIRELMILTEKERVFLDRFMEGEYLPELLFDDQGILDRIKYHPMALWKTRKNSK